ncbi:RNA polymerase recycling motor HelD [Tepidibacillus marianensis]|uniref:RNA polymerase recycling motor HelD n=1 Tax=Tepidibacillus marianensis TaxID=3131995 RepID=UPI0030CD9E83
MSVEEKDWQEEQKRVDYVVEQIQKRIATIHEEMIETKKEIVDIRKNFWEDVRVNFDDTVESAETYASIKQQSEVLGERERKSIHDQKQLTTLNRLHKSPYFGRIDFLEENEKEIDRIYIGIGTFLDEEDNFLIFDWRAPISSLYYDFPPGPAQYRTPVGTIEGEMELKRQFIIRDSKIVSMFDTGVTIGDKLLQEVLGKHSDMQMKSIVATIQKEQNRIIRNEQSKLLIVLGAAGSGKTSAALQRVAYLLYRHRDTLSADQIILFSPNPMFNSYISTVLPELGEENMQQTTFQQYLESRLETMYKIEDPFVQMESLFTSSGTSDDEARMEAIQFKSSARFVDVMDQYLESLRQEGMKYKDILFRKKVIIEAQQIREKFYSYESSLPITNRIQLLSEWLLEQINEFAKIERKEIWVEDEIQLLDKETYLKAYQKIGKGKQLSKEGFDDFDREREILTEMVIQKHLKPLRIWVKQYGFIDIKEIYRNLFTDTKVLKRFISGVEFQINGIQSVHKL